MQITRERAEMAARREVPRSIRLIVIFHYVGAAFAVVFALAALAVGSPAAVGFSLAMAALMMVLASRLRRGEPWARTATMILQVLAFVTALIRLSGGTIDTSLVIAPAIVYTLARNPEARAHFGLAP